MNRLQAYQLARKGIHSFLPRRAVDALRCLRGRRGIDEIVNRVSEERARWILETLAIRYGHLNSIEAGASVDCHNEPIPWYTYPALEYLIQLDFRSAHVFEFGSGASSQFWAKRAFKVTSIEDSPTWFEKLKETCRPNQTMRLEPNPDKYVNAVLESDDKYDVIVVDGSHRPACATVAPQALNDGGLIILDNSDWFVKSAAILRGSSLVQVDFKGFGPLNNYTWTTSLFLSKNFKFQSLKGEWPTPGIGALLDNAAEVFPSDTSREPPAHR